MHHNKEKKVARQEKLVHMFPHKALFSATTQDWRQSRWQPETIFKLFLNVSMKDKLKDEMLLSWDAGGNKW